MYKSKEKWATAITMVMLALLFLLAGTAGLVAYLFCTRAPSMGVTEARLDALKYGPRDPPQDLSMVLGDLQLTLKLEVSNNHDHNAVTFWPLEVRVSFAGVNLSAIRADRPIHLAAEEAMASEYTVKAANMPLSDRATWEFTSISFHFAGEASTRRKLAGLIAIKQVTKLSCNIRFSEPHGTALPFHCVSNNKYLWWNDREDGREV